MTTERTLTSLGVLEPLRPHLRDPSYEFAVGPGWRQLVLQCHLALAAEFPEYEILAVKQKMGSLAFQASPHSGAWTHAEHARLDTVTDVFARRSASVCERRGEVGMLRRSRRQIMLVLCYECESLVPNTATPDYLPGLAQVT